MNPVRVLMILPERIASGRYDGHKPLFVESIRRNRSMDVTQATCDKRMDLSGMGADYDIILFPFVTLDLASKVCGLKDSGVPVVALAGDPHDPKKLDMSAVYERLNVALFFDRYAPSSFYKYHPRSHRYETVVWGLEPSLYTNLGPYEKRIPDTIVISGVIPDTPSFARRAFWRYVRRYPPDLITWNHYRLRTMCAKLPYVIHTQDILPGQTGLELPGILSGYRAAIAATTSIPTFKYLETPAAGCLTFMEITEENDGKYLGYEDGKSAVFIDETNYKSRLKDYLDTRSDPKWQKIALAGHKHTLENLTNDNATDRLALLMRRLLDGDLR